MLKISFILVCNITLIVLAVADENALLPYFLVEEAIELHREPDPFSDVVVQVKRNTRITILEKDGQWYRVKYDGRVAYVFEEYVRKVRHPAIEREQEEMRKQEEEKRTLAEQNRKIELEKERKKEEKQRMEAKKIMQAEEARARKEREERLIEEKRKEQEAYISGGAFTMGANKGEVEGFFIAEKKISAKVSDYYMARREVTVGEFREFVQETGYKSEATVDGEPICFVRSYTLGLSWESPGFRQTDDHPVVCVSLKDAQAYAKWRSKKTGLSYRLPTSAEWEYAARAGTSTSRYWGNKLEQACDYSNVYDNRAKRSIGLIYRQYDCDDGYIYTAPVGKFKPNHWGLYDMIGNVEEWTCSSGESKNRKNEIQCATDEGEHITRGGSYRDDESFSRSAATRTTVVDTATVGLGFRLVRDP